MGEKTLNRANAVILARSHNPTIASKEWIVEKGVIEEPIINFIHTPAFSMVEGNDFTIHVDSNRMQISAKKVESDIINKLPIVVETYVSSLPDFENFIVTLNLPPEEKIIANFNFHSDVKRGSSEIIENLKFYREAVKKS